MVRLEDLFRRFPQTPMSVEVKERNEELIHKVVVQAGLGAGPGLDGGLTPPPQGPGFFPGRTWGSWRPR